MTSNNDTWPEIPLAEWKDTYDTLQRWTQIVGKIRLALDPLITHSGNTTLYVNSRGLTTSAMSHNDINFQMDFDFIDPVPLTQTKRIYKDHRITTSLCF